MNYKLYFKFIPYAIILGLVIALSVTQCSRQKIKVESNDKVFEAVVKSDKARIKALEATVKEQKKQLSDKHKTDSVTIARLQRSEKSLKRQVLIARVNIQPIADTVKEVETFVQATDSLDVVQQALIDTLIDQKAIQWRTFNALLSTAEEKNKVQIELNSHYQDLNKQLSKQVKRERNRKTLWKVIAGGLVVGIVYQSVNN